MSCSSQLIGVKLRNYADMKEPSDLLMLCSSTVTLAFAGRA